MNAYDCPFCPLVISEDMPRAAVTLLAFEHHLDVHMLRHDQLLPVPSGVAS